MGTHDGAIAVPLPLAPSLDEKTWGGRKLERLGKQLPPGPIGESLESGPEAVVASGPFAGRALADLARTHASALLGSRGMASSGEFGDFPLLIKLIDAHDDLSVQVHPNDAEAPTGKRGKTEAWYILDAEPGARIVTGVDGPIEIARIGEQLVESVVTPGDVFFVPAGTVHAIGAGVLLYEIQQTSDVTWRLYDWGRPREIHVEAALAAARPEQRAARIASLQISDGRDLLVACRYFALERWQMSGTTNVPPRPDTFRVVTVIEGDVSVADVHLPRGTTAVLPADMPATQMTGSGTVLMGYVPDLERDVRQPLLEAGHDRTAIRQLGADL